LNKKILNHQRPYRKNWFNIVDVKKDLKIWWDSPFKLGVESAKTSNRLPAARQCSFFYKGAQIRVITYIYIQHTQYYSISSSGYPFEGGWQTRSTWREVLAQFSTLSRWDPSSILHTVQVRTVPLRSIQNMCYSIKKDIRRQRMLKDLRRKADMSSSYAKSQFWWKSDPWTEYGVAPPYTSIFLSYPLSDSLEDGQILCLTSGGARYRSAVVLLAGQPPLAYQPLSSYWLEPDPGVRRGSTTGDSD
jgi:hypothetical protein